MNHRSELVPLVVVHTRETVLLKHEHAQSVAGVEEFRCCRIMARTNGIASHRLQLSHRPRLHGIGHSHSHSCMVLMHIYA